MYFICTFPLARQEGFAKFKTMVLTANEQKILDYIRRYFEKKGYVPSNMEIHNHFGFKSKNSVRQYLKALKTKGAIEWSEGTYEKRTIRLMDPPTPDTPGLSHLYIEGQVAAGLLTEAVENREPFAVADHLLKSGFEHFALQVKGDSMIGDHIMDGDVIVVRKSDNFENGQMAVVDVDGEATLKRLYKKGQTVELRPSNPEYESVFFKSKTGFRVLGVVCHVSRNI